VVCQPVVGSQLPLLPHMFYLCGGCDPRTRYLRGPVFGGHTYSEVSAASSGRFRSCTKDETSQAQYEVAVAVDNLRTILIIAICAVSFMLWQAWVRDYSPQATHSENGFANLPETERSDTNPESIGVPAVPEITNNVEGSDVVWSEQTSNNRVSVVTDVFDIQMDSNVIHSLQLRNYPISVDDPSRNFALLNPSLPNLFTAESGLLGSNGEPNQQTEFQPVASNFVLEEGVDELPVIFTWEGPSGLKIVKTYLFKRGRYDVDVTYRIENYSGERWSGRMYGQFRRNPVEREGGLFAIYTYTGGILSSPDKSYEKVDFGELSERDIKRQVTGGWLAMIQHYFAGAWVPNSRQINHYYSRAADNDAAFLLGVYHDELVEPNTTGEISLTTYLGPKIQKDMEAVAPGLKRTVDYGWLFFISQPMFVVLAWINSAVNNWGWTIIIFTILLKICFFWLSATSYRSMARMRKLQPRMMQLRERHGDDKQRLNQAMMEMYKKEKINPLGGCLPILVQIPFFIALYWVLLESVELRQAPFMLWYQDLAQHDPYFVLPILMGISMVAQQKLNPTPPDPLQAKIMMALPFIFTFFFLFFPAGLVLYWFVNNVLSIAQQWVITRRIENEK